MRITILTVGTLGDIQPYVALGAGLRDVGHDVQVATSSRFAPLLTERGLAHTPLAADFLQLVETSRGKAALAGRGRLKLLSEVMPMLRRLLDEGWQAARESDAIIYHPKALSGYHIAEKLGVPGILAHPVPFASPTAAFPTPLLPLPNLGGALNRLSHRLIFGVSTAPYRRMTNRWRREVLGLPPMSSELVLHGRPVPKLYGYSRHVLPAPSDWDDSTAVTGYWFLDRPVGWQAPADLERFLEAGPAPVYIGFGSMAAEDPARVAALVVEALDRAGLRGVLAAGAGGLVLDTAPSHIHVVESVPHDWLFPRMAAVVHHGGAGTTAAGLRAGVPAVICPFFGDQPFWGRRVAALGVGPAPIPQKRLTAAALTEALRAAVGDAAMRERAADLGALIRGEDGVGQAVAFVEAQLRQPIGQP